MGETIIVLSWDSPLVTEDDTILTGYRIFSNMPVQLCDSTYGNMHRIWLVVFNKQSSMSLNEIHHFFLS